jgi:hypothetical protein
LVSEVGGSDRIGFFNSRHDRKYATTGVRNCADWIGVIDYCCQNEDLFYGATRKMEDMEFLKAMLAEMNANTKSLQEKIHAETEAIRAETKAIQAEMKSMRDRRMEATMRDDALPSNDGGMSGQ